MKRTHLLLGVLILAALTQGTLCGARLSRQPTQIQRRMPQSTQQRGGSSVLTDEDKFVQAAMAQSGNGKFSKWVRPELVSAVEKRVQKSLNYDILPKRYRRLVDANRDQYFFLGATEKEPFYAYHSQNFSLREAKHRIIVRHHKLDADKMMAIFEPAGGGKPFFTIPENVLKTFPEADQAYAKKLSAVVNESVSFLFDVPFFVPDMERFKRGDYAGKFIPEKYLLTGKRLDRVPAGLVDPDKKDLYNRWGWPVYDLSQVETGEIQDVSGCFLSSEYSKLKVVDHLILLNLDMTDPENETDAIEYIQVVQYKRALTSLDLLKKAPAAERDALRTNGELTPAREKIISVIEKQLDKVIPPAERLLQQGVDNMGKKQFIYSLRQPGGKPQRLQRISVMKPEYTSGHQKERSE